jgi:hypothetical protein
MVVKGEKNLKTCGLLDHKQGAVHPHMASGQGQVRVTFDTVAQEINSKQVASPLKQAAQYPAEDFEGEDRSDDAINVSAELAETENITVLEHYADQFIRRHSPFKNETDAALNISSSLERQSTQHVRHARKRLKDFESHVSDRKKSRSDKKEQRNRQNKHLEQSMKGGNKDESDKMLGVGVSENTLHNSNEEEKIHGEVRQKVKRAVHFAPTHLLDGGVEHGGNAGNMSEVDQTESSVSSFENSLLTCYDGQILLAQSFLPSPTCTDVHVIEKHEIGRAHV